MKEDRVRVALDAGKIAVGAFCRSSDPDFYEQCGWLGYDFIWVESEHTDMTGTMKANAILAGQAGGASVFVRIPAVDLNLAKPVLDAGADGIIFPNITCVEDARKAIAACRFPPKGNRGFGGGRGMKHGETPMVEYLEHVENNIWRILQIEHVNAVRELDEILALDGLSAVICGPMDLSASIGKLGQLGDPEVSALMKTIAEKALAAGIPFGIASPGDNPMVQQWKEWGATLLAIGDHISYFAKESKVVLAKYKG